MLLSDPAQRSRGGMSNRRIGPHVCTSRHVTSRFAVAVRLLIFALIVLASHASLHAQTIEDGIMLSRDVLWSGALYTHDAWDHYWEGTYNRTNGNLGTVTTQTMDFTANYGVLNRLNVIGTLPLVWTQASQGVLHGQTGFQDLTLAVKYELIRRPLKNLGTIRFIPVVSGSIPTTGYEPDFQPMSIGLHSKTITPRATLNFQGLGGVYINGTAGYVLRSNVTLDRNYYYTNGQLYLSNEVAMPNQFVYVVSAGLRRHDWMVVGNFSQQQTRGGGDIRPQDLPFVSNRMNFSKAGVSAVVPVPLPLLHGLQYWFTYSNTFDGRNVGQSSTYVSGLMYQVKLHRRGAK